MFLDVAPAPATIGVASQMLLGNPSNATADTNNHSHYLLQRSVEALDYNDTLRQPNWASWHLTTADTGASGRSGRFFLDTTLPPNCYWVKTNAYSGSGYDRGHISPSGDRTDTIPHNEETFLMSNLIPQAPDNNPSLTEPRQYSTQCDDRSDFGCCCRRSGHQHLHRQRARGVFPRR